jgi:acyl carrier protein
MSKTADIDKQLRPIVQKKAKREIDFETTLADAGLDSLDLIEIGFDIEDQFKVNLPQSQQEIANYTYGDLCRLVEEHMAAVEAPAEIQPTSAPVKRPHSNPTGNEAAIDRSLHQ